MASHIDTFLEELKQEGYDYDDVNEIFKEKVLSENVVEKILEWLPSIYEEHLGSGNLLTRSLISAATPYNPSVLIHLFEHSSYNDSVKWAIAHVLSVSKTYDISGWIKSQLLNHAGSRERSGLLDGLVIKAGIKDKGELMNILKALFDRYCYFEKFMKLFIKYGSKEDIPFLQAKLENPDMTDYLKYMNEADKELNINRAKHADKIYQREVNKVIDGIQKRKRENLLPKSV